MRYILTLLILSAATPLQSQQPAISPAASIYSRTETINSSDPTSPWGLPGPYAPGHP